MKTDLFKFLQHRSELKFNKKVFVFLVCLLIAFCSWLQINLSKEYIENIPFKVEFVNLSKIRFGTTRITDTLFLEVEADGYSLLKYEMKSVTVDFRKLKKDRDAEAYYFLPNLYIKTFARHLGENFKMLRAINDTVQLNPTLK